MKISLRATESRVVVKQLSVERQSLHIPDETVQKTFYGHVIDCGKLVTQLDKGYVCLFENKPQVRYKDFYVFDQYDTLLVRSGKIYRPIGNRILIKRKLFERTTSGGIIIPDCYQTVDQSKDGIVYSAGLNNKKIIDIENDWGIHIGDEVMLDGWKNEHKEIEINREYYLSVRLKDILYCSKNEQN